MLLLGFLPEQGQLLRKLLYICHCADEGSRYGTAPSSTKTFKGRRVGCSWEPTKALALLPNFHEARGRLRLRRILVLRSATLTNRLLIVRHFWVLVGASPELLVQVLPKPPFEVGPQRRVVEHNEFARCLDSLLQGLRASFNHPYLRRQECRPLRKIKKRQRVWIALWRWSLYQRLRLVSASVFETAIWKKMFGTLRFLTTLRASPFPYGGSGKGDRQPDSGRSSPQAAMPAQPR
eukprot:3218208-Amphidinium_carterae.2